MLSIRFSSTPELPLRWLLFFFLFFFFFSLIVLGLIGSAVVSIAHCVGDLLEQLCFLFGGRSGRDEEAGDTSFSGTPPASSMGSVVCQTTRAGSGTMSPALRWWLDHGPYLFNSSPVIGLWEL
ncbi:hypothetical protein L873DRAFT_1813664 [Choiromyces venosus 120613-1]|uniref:Uncharacterized protein n=1 Tax=Choiromyces venosus 120613-1 TaxID=1336337 RepID=A0A3N4J9F7_9PEZI|nr:hypothetical protein L873DRAFT_1813664 [Choiromyces venosus 120613-1]